MELVATSTRGGTQWGRVLASLVVVVLTAVVCVAAVAQRSAASTSPAGDLFSSGGRALPGGSVDFQARHLVPGQTVTGTVVVTNDGDAPGHFVISAEHPAAASTASDAALLEGLQVTMTDVTDSARPVPVYSGSPAGLSGVDLGSLQPGEARTYRVAATLCDTSAPAQGGRLPLGFEWTAVTAD